MRHKNIKRAKPHAIFAQAPSGLLIKLANIIGNRLARQHTKRFNQLESDALGQPFKLTRLVKFDQRPKPRLDQAINNGL